MEKEPTPARDCTAMLERHRKDTCRDTHRYSLALAEAVDPLRSLDTGEAQGKDFCRQGSNDRVLDGTGAQPLDNAQLVRSR